MDPALITALAAVAVSIVGGLTSFATTFLTQRYQARHDLLSSNSHIHSGTTANLDLRPGFTNGTWPRCPCLVDVKVNRQEHAMPPTITVKQALGFSLYMMRAVLSGRETK
jgi:hypothetical protein